MNREVVKRLKQEQGKQRKFKQEKSCGAVVYTHTQGLLQILLIRHKNGGHWSFPKGHVEANETEEETAYREILEETGLLVRIDRSFRASVSYSPKPGVIKEVVYFAGTPKTGTLQAQEAEIMDLGWFSMKKAVPRVNYDRDREILSAFQKWYAENQAQTSPQS